MSLKATKHCWNFLAVQGSPESPNQNKTNKKQTKNPPSQIEQTRGYSHHLGKEEHWSEEKGKEDINVNSTPYTVS